MSILLQIFFYWLPNLCTWSTSNPSIIPSTICTKPRSYFWSNVWCISSNCFGYTPSFLCHDYRSVTIFHMGFDQDYHCGWTRCDAWKMRSYWSTEAIFSRCWWECRLCTRLATQSSIYTIFCSTHKNESMEKHNNMPRVCLSF